MKRMKKICSLLVIVMAITLAAPGTVFGYEKTMISMQLNSQEATVNGEVCKLDVPARTVENRMMVPIRFISESMGIEVEWVPEGRQVNIGNGQIILTVNSKTALVNGENVAMEVPAIVESGRVLVPIRFAGENMGGTVSWDEEAFTATIEYSAQWNKAVDVYNQKADSEDAVLSELSAQTGWEFAKQMIQIGSAKDGSGFRMAGTPEAKQTADLVFAKFKELGLNPQYHTYPAYAWRYRDSSLSIKGMEGHDVPVVGVVGSPGTPKDGITAELVDAGFGTKAELAGLDLEGKIALIALDFDLLPWYSQTATQAEEHGATGAIYYCVNGYGQREDGEAFAMSDWQGILGTIPLLNTPYKYGKELKEILKEGPATVTLKLDVETKEKATGYNVIGSITGSKYPDEYVLLNAHMDAYFYGWQDDTLAISGMVAIADAMAKSGYKPERTIVFMAFDGEEWGNQDSVFGWLSGSWHYMKDNWEKYAGKTVGSITFESMGYVGTEQLTARSSDVIFPFIKSAATGIDAPSYSNPDLFVRNSLNTWSDEWSMAYHGIPTMRTHTDPNFTETNYHSQFDAPELTDINKYADNLRTYATLLLRMDQLPVMPYDLSLTPEKFAASLDVDTLKSYGLDESLINAAGSFQKEAAVVFGKNLEITQKYQEAKAEGADLTAGDQLLKEYNQALRDVAVTVVSGANQLQFENVTYGTAYYQNLINSADETIANLEKGDGKAAIEAFDFPGVYYSEFMDYKPWWNINRELFAGYAKDRFWGTKALVQYDVYQLADNIRTKAESANSDYSAEIVELKKIKNDVESRLKAMVIQDTAMWDKAKSQLPIELAEEILESLQ